MRFGVRARRCAPRSRPIANDSRTTAGSQIFREFRAIYQKPIDLSLKIVYISISINMAAGKTIPEKFLPLKPHWFYILLSVSGQDQHGYGIMQDVLDRTAGKVRLWPATLYGTIKRLMESELIEESSQRPAPEHDDERRRYYRLTRLGRRVLAAETERLENLVRAVHAKSGLLSGRISES